MVSIATYAYDGTCDDIMTVSKLKIRDNITYILLPYGFGIRTIFKIWYFVSIFQNFIQPEAA